MRGLAGVLPDIEIAAIEPLLSEIEALKASRRAVILAHNYMTRIFTTGLPTCAATRSPSPGWRRRRRPT